MASISLVIPAKDEEDNIQETVSSIVKILYSLCTDYQIILINDGSVDKTKMIMEGMRRIQGNRIRILHNEANRGMGACLRSAFSVATKDLILYTDMDMPVRANDIKKAVEIFEKGSVDILSLYRDDWKRESFLHSIYSYVYNFFVQIFFDVKVRDISFACKLFKREILQKISIRSDTAFAKTEFLIKCSRLGYRILQFPVRYNKRKKGVSKFNNFQKIFNILREAVIFRCQFYSA
ncbi:MAG: glycosyltransferase [Candidatus Omnitrophica bacterium]|nr:glycosyltransferase [Candidatus Omnitrophota bacterium]